MQDPRTSYGENGDDATPDRDLAVLSDRLLAGVAVLAGEVRRQVEAASAPSQLLDLYIMIEERIAAELARRRGRAA